MNDITKLMVRTAYDALDEKLGQDIEIIDIQNISVISDIDSVFISITLVIFVSNFDFIASNSKSVLSPQEYVSDNFFDPIPGISTLISRGIGVNNILLFALSNDNTENLSGGFCSELSLGTVHITNIFVSVSDSLGILIFDVLSDFSCLVSFFTLPLCSKLSFFCLVSLITDVSFGADSSCLSL